MKSIAILTLALLSASAFADDTDNRLNGACAFHLIQTYREAGAAEIFRRAHANGTLQAVRDYSIAVSGRNPDYQTLERACKLMGIDPSKYKQVVR
jgi:hypothetical protein